MTVVQKNDVNQIFAEQAPSIDKPATFANYPRGWDESRKNNGKPLIKQFNYLQQRTDQNILWIHQNGAGLPYDESIEYADEAIVRKDGELQQLKDGQWKPTKDSDVIKTVESIADLLAIQNPKDGQVAYANNSLFKFNPLTTGLNNTGTLFNGWERQYYQDVWLEWFGLTDGGNIADVLLKALPLAKLQHINFKCKKGNYFINKQVKVTDIQGFELDFNGSKIDVRYNDAGKAYDQFLYIDGIIDRTASLTATNVGTLKNVWFDGSSTDQEPSGDGYTDLVHGITIAGFKTINLFNFKATNWAGQCTKFHVTNYVNVENVVIDNVGYASDRDAAGDAFYIGERDGLCYVNMNNVQAKGKIRLGANSRIGITIENLNRNLRKDAGCVIVVDNCTFEQYNRFIHAESLESWVHVTTRNSTIGSDIAYFSYDIDGGKPPLYVVSMGNNYHFYDKTYAGSTGLTRQCDKAYFIDDTIDASQTMYAMGQQARNVTYLDCTFNGLKSMPLLTTQGKAINCTINMSVEVGLFSYESGGFSFIGCTLNGNPECYSIWSMPKMKDCTFNNIKSGSLDQIEDCEFYFDTTRIGYEAAYGANIDAKVYHDNVLAYQPIRYAIKKGATVANATATDDTAVKLNALIASLKSTNLIA